MSRDLDRGFSLIELVVALSIFAVVGLMAQQGLVTMLRGSERLSERAEELAELQVAVARITRDIENATARPWRSGVRQAEPPFTLARGGADLTVVRTAPPDPTGEAVSAFLRVVYAASTTEPNRVRRAEWRRVDAPPSQPDRTGLVSPLVTSVQFSALDGRSWVTAWPPETAATDGKPLPDAVAIEITTTRWGRLRRIVALR